LLGLILAAALPVRGDTLRIATFHAELERKGPGLLLRDILRGEDRQVAAVAAVVARVDPDILLLQGVDYDHGLVTLRALRDVIAQSGADYPHLFALRPNTGMPTGHDMDGDGRRGRARDRQGFGLFSGQGGMALLSRHPVLAAQAQDFSGLLWHDLPGALLPETDGRPFPSADARAALRLASVAHWVVPVEVPQGRLHLLAFHAAPPVFDGPEDRNGRRNHDQLRFWRLFLDGRFGPAPGERFVLLGDANLDPVDGAGRKGAIRALLADPRLQDPRPARPAPARQSAGQAGDPRLDTVAWPTPDPGHLRVSYVLPSADLRVIDAGVHWPSEGAPGAAAAGAASRHRVVWVDVALD
jgi:hypothetical protein